MARTIAITDPTQVSFSGAALTVNPNADLAAGASYYVNLAAGVVKDMAGNAFAAYGARLPGEAAQRIDALPTAAAMLRLAPALLAAGLAVPPDQALPRYIRDKVAKTTDERAAERAAANPPATEP